MPYVADLFYMAEGKHVSVASKLLNTADEKVAIRIAVEWSATEMATLIDRVMHLVVTQAGRSIFTKTYGEI